MNIAVRLKISVDPELVRRSLDSLLVKGQYRTFEEQEKGNWGSTALAVRALSDLGQPIPSEVSNRAKEALLQALPVDGVNAVIQDLAPLLDIMSIDHTARRSLSPDYLNAAYRQALGKVSRMGPDVVGLAAEYQLRNAATSLNLVGADDKTISINCDLVKPSGGVPLPGETHDDLQATYYALKVNCPTAVVPPPSIHSRAGWPDPLSSWSQSLRTSAAAVRVAHNVGMLDEFVPDLRRSLERHWIPALTAKRSANLETIVQVARVKEIAFHAGYDTVRTSHWSISGEDPISVLAYTIGLSVDVLSDDSSDAAEASLLRMAKSAEKFTDESPIYYAAILELASRSLKQDHLHSEAQAILAKLRISENVYRARLDESAEVEASFTASVVGSWIDGATAFPQAHFVAAGVCAPDGRCAETPSDLVNAQHYSLKALSVMLSSQSFADNDLYPLPL